ncbi:MAG: hypothetical protein E6J72_00480 [Deltaproteobacteria bacterium]|nr:MAG: hypothetical protein E6J72_00480 [Deltaproteobacteria bacterium]
MANEHQNESVRAEGAGREQPFGREQPGREQPGREQQRDGGRRTSRPLRIQERGREAYRDAQHLASTLEQAVDEIGQFLREQAEQRPYTSLATAAGVGYVLGGGVPSRLTRFLFGLGSRLAIEMFLHEFIGDAARQPSAAPGSTASRSAS